MRDMTMKNPGLTRKKKCRRDCLWLLLFREGVRKGLLL